MTINVVCPGCHSSVPTDAPSGLCPECLLRHGFPGIDDPTFVPAAERKRFSSPTLTELASAFPELEILEFIGAGGMGSVYRARQKSLDRVVALKVLHREISGDIAFAERFGREARAMARLNHPSIVGVHESGRAGNFYYLMMEFVAGVTLREMISGEKLDPATALAMTPHICEALEYAHAQGVVHRDIKPENILIDLNGGVKIADFGLAKLTGRTTDHDALTQPQQVMGTLHYMAPEQLRGEQGIDHRVDIYSLGVVIYEMLTGQLPIGRFELPSQRVSIDVRIDDVVLRTLEQDPNRRYQRIAHVKTEIDSICHDPEAGAPKDSRTTTDGIRESRRHFAINTGVCAAILVTTFLPWGTSQPRNKHDLDFQFLLDNGGAAGESIYRRIGGVEFAFLPEGKRINAWHSSVGLRQAAVNAPTPLDWRLQLPNWIVPIVTIIIGLLYAYRHAGRAPPRYLIPLLALAGGLLTWISLIAVAYRGDFEFAPVLTVIGFACCLFESITTSLMRQPGRFRSGRKIGHGAQTASFDA